MSALRKLAAVCLCILGSSCSNPPCDAGFDHDGRPSTQCRSFTDCAPGTFVTFQGNNTTDRECAPCPFGTFSASANAPVCLRWQTCPAGSRVTAEGSATTDRQCGNCPEATFNSTENSDSCAAWADCARGTFVSVANPIVGRVCQACVPSTFSQSINATQCLPWVTCAAGSFVSRLGTETFDRQCTPCAPGSFTAETNARQCTNWTQCQPQQVELLPPTPSNDRRCVQEPWTRQFGAAGGATSVRAMAVSAQGFVAVAGDTSGQLTTASNAGEFDAYVHVFHPNGASKWTRQFGTVRSEFATAVAFTPSGDIVVAGFVGGTLPGQTALGDDDLFVRVFANDGTERWTRQFGSNQTEEAKAVVVDGSGNITVAGFTYGSLPGFTSRGYDDVFIRRFDSAGTVVWTTQVGTAENDSAEALLLLENGDLMVAGTTNGAFPGQTNAGNADAFVMRLDSNGGVVWTRQFGTSSDEVLLAIAAFGTSGFVTSGMTRGAMTGTTSLGGSDVFVRLHDPQGVEVWTKQLGTSGDDQSRGLATNARGEVFVGATVAGALTGQPLGSSDGALVRLDERGALKDVLQLGTVESDIVSSVCTDADGLPFVSGNTDGTLPGQTKVGATNGFVLRLVR